MWCSRLCEFNSHKVLEIVQCSGQICIALGQNDRVVPAGWLTGEFCILSDYSVSGSIHSSSMKFIIKLFPEITNKSAPVRKQLVKQLRRNIRTVCRSVDDSLEVTGKWDMIEVETSLSEPADIATPG